MSTDIATLPTDDLRRQLSDARTNLSAALTAKRTALASYGPLAEETYRRDILQAYPDAVRVELDPDDYDNGRFLVVSGVFNTAGEEIVDACDLRDVIDVDEMEADLTALHGTDSSYALHLQPQAR
jgi:hypothetical protein